MSDTRTSPQFGAFLPVTLLALAVLGTSTWDLSLALRQRALVQRMDDQQELQISQAVELEARMRTMLEELVMLAKTDEQADGIVKKFKIAFTPAAPQTASAQVKAESESAPAVAPTTP